MVRLDRNGSAKVDKSQPKSLLLVNWVELKNIIDLDNPSKIEPGFLHPETRCTLGSGVWADDL